MELDQQTLDGWVKAYPGLQDLYPATGMQLGMVFHSLLEGRQATYVIHLQMDFEGGFDADVFRRAWRELQSRHAILRTAFVGLDREQPLQVVVRQAPLEWHEEDWRALDREAQEQAFARYRDYDKALGFDFGRAPLTRMSLMRLSEHKYRWLWTYHHSLLDGWSVAAVMGELFEHYEGLLSGRKVTLPRRAEYRNYIAWLSAQDPRAAEAYWREALSEVTPTPLGLSERRGSGEDAEQAEQALVISAQRTESLRKAARRHGVTLNTVLQGAWAYLLHRYSGARQVVFGQTVSGRSLADVVGIEGMVGLFINTLPAVVEIARDADVGGWLRRLQQEQARRESHGYLPLVEIQRLAGLQAGEELFDTLLVFENYLVEQTGNGASRPRFAISGQALHDRTVYGLTLIAVPATELSLKMLYQRDRFSRESIAALLRHLDVILEGLTDAGTMQVQALPYLSKTDHEELVERRNATARAYLHEKCIHELFEEQVRQRPDAVALVYEGGELTYRELNRRANQVARYLLERGVGPEVRVGLCMERSAEMVIGLLGILKAGGCYVPMDPEYPQARLEYMLAQSGCRMVLSQQHLMLDLPLLSTVKVAPLDARLHAALFGAQSDADIEVERSGLHSANLAYVIYTSGSTGEPKGVGVTHRSLHNLAVFQSRSYGLDGASRMLQFASLSFDAACWDWSMALTAGSVLHLPTAETVKSGELLGMFVKQWQITYSYLPPAFLSALNADDFSSVQTLTIGGESTTLDALEGWRRGRRLINAYGPTEATVVATTSDVSEATHTLSIGRPIENVTAYALDGAGQLVPSGVVGELCIGGEQLARGYLNRAALTAERFVPHPLARKAGERLYRTGDLTRWLPDGQLEFMGRADDQVKVRGFRIELGEIESVLLGHEAVRDAVVVARDEGRSKRLVGYVVATAGAQVDEVALVNALRGRLQEQLPSHMVPSTLMVLASLPLTANGKVDRKALLAPGVSSQQQAFVPPTTQVERGLCEIWQTVLRVERIGVEDNFFAAGGDSILSIQVVSLAKARGLRLTVRELFEHPTIAALARQIDLAQAQEMPDAVQAQQASEGEMPLLPIHHRLFESGAPRPQHYHQSQLLSVPEGFSLEFLRSFVAALYRRHDALRLCYRRADEQWHGHFAPLDEALIARSVLNEKLPGASAAQRLKSARAVKAGFDLQQGPLFKAVYYDAGRVEDSTLLLVLHHLIVDGVSWRVLLHDLSKAFEQWRSGKAIELAPKTTSYQQWAGRLQEHASSTTVRDERDYWVRQMSQPLPPLPLDNAAEAAATQEEVEQTVVALEPEETEALLTRCVQVYRAQIQELLLAGLLLAFHQWTGQRRLRVNVEGHGREEGAFAGVDLSETVGWFTSMYPVYLELPEVGEDEPALLVEAIKQAKEQLRSVPQHGLNYGVLRYLGRDEQLAKLERAHGAPVLFNYLGQFDQQLGKGAMFAPAPGDTGRDIDAGHPCEHLLDLNGAVIGGCLRFVQSYHPRQLGRGAAEQLGSRYALALRRIVQHSQAQSISAYTPSDLPLARVDRQTLDGWVQAYPGIEDLYPATGMQRGLMFHSLMDGRQETYAIHLQMDFEAGFDADVFKRAWEELQARHAILRTAFVGLNREQPLQVVVKQAPLQWREEDWRALDQEAQEQAFARYREYDKGLRFDFGRAPLMRMTLMRLSHRKYRWLWTHHHSLLDGWSVATLMRELFEQYEGLLSDRKVTFARRADYRNYIAWLCAQDQSSAQTYWREALSGVTPVRLGLPERHGSEQDEAQAEQVLVISAPRTEVLKKAAQRHGVTLNTVLQGAWAYLLHRYSGARAVVFGQTVSGRTTSDVAGIEGMVGLFINTLPAPVKITRDADIGEWLRRLQQEQAQRESHGYLPLVEIQRLTGLQAGQELFDTLLVFENYPLGESVKRTGSAEARPRLQVDAVRVHEGPNYGLTLVAMPAAELSLKMIYQQYRYSEETIAALLGNLSVILDGLADVTIEHVQALPYLSKADREELVRQPHATAHAYPQDKCIHELFEAQVEQTPDRIAVAHEGGQLTYEDLNRRANQLAHRLIERGVGPETRVGLCMQHSADRTIGLLGILKAGGCYVPMDPESPELRLAYVIRDSALEVIVTRRALEQTLDLESLAGDEGRLECVSVDGDRTKTAATANPVTCVRPENLAYAIYSPDDVGELSAVLGTHRSRHDLATFQSMGLLLEEPSKSSDRLSSFDPARRFVYSCILGESIENVSAYVLSPDGELLPKGVAGELYLGGVGMSRGYLNRPAQTAEKFVPHTLGKEAGERLYRTGDFARWLPDGMLEFVSRADQSLPAANAAADPLALPAPQVMYAPPEGMTEELLAQLWSTVLECERVGRHDSFFALGGHSLLATQLVSRIREVFSTELPLRELFEHPTLSSQARAIERMRGAGALVDVAIEAVSREQPLPLSHAQQRLWFLNQYMGPSSVYNMPLALRLHGEVNEAALLRSLDELYRRHESLRTRFESRGASVVQVIDPPQFELKVEVVSSVEAREIARAERSYCFDLSSEPLCRIRLLRETGCESGDYVLLLTMHHSVSDGWSLGIFFRELVSLYRAYANAEISPLEPLPIQYADYAQWQRRWLQGDVLEKQLSYWREQLEGLPPLLTLPTDRPRPVEQTFRGSMESFAMPASLAEKLQALSREQGVSLYMTLLSAFAVLLGRYASQQDVAVGTPIANRTRRETEGLIGFFANTLVMRHDLSGDPRFVDLLKNTRAMALQAYAHQDVPFEQLVEELNPRRSLSHSPLFQVMFILQNVPLEAPELPGLAVLPLAADQGEMPEGTARFDMTLSVQESPAGLVGVLEYNTDLFERNTIQRMLDHYRRLLEAIVDAPLSRLSRLQMAGEREQRQQLIEWNATAHSYPDDKCIHELFEAQVERAPDRIALIHESRELTFGELNRRANALAHHLIERGVAPEVRVGLCIPRSAEMVIGILAILKAGGCYVPLDPDYPRKRLDFLIEDARIGIVVTESDVLELPADQRSQNVDARASGLCPDHPAYLIYTSASTGVPKGVLGLHRSTVNRVNWLARSLGVGADEVLCQKTSVGFVDHVAEIFQALSAGVPLVIIAPALLQAPQALLRELDTRRVTQLTLVPSLLKTLLAAGQGEPARWLKSICSSGEALHLSGLEKLNECFPRARLFNIYGSTEMGADVTCHEVTAENAGLWAPIGNSIDNTQAYILDTHGQLTVAGAVGELHVGGVCLARGYFQRAGLTAEKFVPHPFTTQPGARVYRTGDLARRLPDGTLEYVGRVDHQVKVRGFRIELGEIESTLLAHKTVRDAVVIAAPAHLAPAADPGDRRLVSYVVAKSHMQTDDGALIQQLRGHLQEQLPGYMVPSAFVLLDSMPLTATGKVDRRALPVPEETTDAESSPPEGVTEELLAELWCGLLKRERVGRHENFFELGGHSLLATQLVSRIREAFSTELSVRQVFEHPTLCAQARAVEQARAVGALAEIPLEAVSREQLLPLSYAQQRLWFLHQYMGPNTVYNMPLALRLHGEVNEAALVHSLNELYERHESLRTRFETRDGSAVQVIDPPALDLEVERVSAAAAQTIAGAERAHRFDLSGERLCRIRLLHETDEMHDYVLLVTMHHSVSDGWSLGIFFRELVSLYRAYANAERSPLAPLPIQYADYAQWQRRWLQGAVLEKQVSYWRSQLEGLPPLLTLPTDHARPAEQTFAGSMERFALPAALAEKLNALSRDQGVSLYMTLLSAFAVLLGRYAGQQDVAVGTAIANRTRRETEGVIGFFVNTLVMRHDLSGDPRFVDLLKRTRMMALQAYAHQDIPFEQLVEQLNPQRSVSHSPLFQVMFDLQNAPFEALELPGLAVQPLAADQAEKDTLEGTARFDLTLSMQESPGRLMGAFEYNTALFERNTIQRMLAHYTQLLESIVATPQSRLSRLEMLGEPEKRQQLIEWNATACAYPDDKCIHELIDAQAQQTPDRIALVHEGQSLTYSELEGRANQIAHYLIERGAGPDTRVALCMERSLEMVIGLLGILKAGAAYVPLEPSYPPRRLTYMMADSAPVAILTHSAVEQSVREHLVAPASNAPVLDLVADAAQWAACGREQPRSPALTPAHVAYVIYTSGSTGQPKGVMVAHRGLVNRLWWMQQAYGLDQRDAVLQKTPFSFDVSVWEFLWPLMVGAKLVMARPDGHKDPDYLIDAVRRQQITVMHFVPSMLQAFLDADGVSNCSTLARVVCSGEALSGALARRFRQWLPHVDLQNLYGPTEATVDVTAWACIDTREDSIPIGRPIANTQMYVLDETLQPLPAGVPGDLHIGGVGLAVGYLNRPDLTAERFVPSLYPSARGERLYRTGDLARWRSDGSLEYLGRVDHQVKIRGFRIELGEIEASLTQHPAVQDAHVLVRDYGGQDRRIVAYLVPSPHSAFPVHQLLRMQRDGLEPGAKLIELPNGLTVFHQNASETAFSYEEIFSDEVYARHGIRLADDDCIFDVGANIGLFTLFAGQRCRNAKFYAFEPLPPVFESLQRNAKLYGLNAKLFQCGLADRARQESFTFYPHATVISSRLTSPEAARQVVKAYLQNQQGVDDDGAPMSEQLMNELLQERLQTRQYTCQLKALSEVIAEEGVERIDLLKIDVENAELEVLRGIEARDWPKIRQLVVEVHDVNGRLRQVVDLLASHGYDVKHEQDKLLHSTALHNVYAVRLGGSVDTALPAEPAPPAEPRWANQRWANQRSLLHDLQMFLRAQIPEYMVPAAYVLLDEMPLTPNGKLDRGALPAPEASPSESEFAPPEGVTEGLLAELWCAVLKRESVGRHASFFELGGHSLLATQLVSRVRKAFSIELSVRQVFEHPTLSSQARAIERARSAGALIDLPLEMVPRDQPLPLSYAQQRLWFLHQYMGPNAVYNMPLALRLQGEVNETALVRSLEELHRRHESLRTRFEARDGGAVQVIDPPELELEVEAVSAAEAQAIARGERSYHFDLSRERLCRIRLLRETAPEPGDYLLLVTMHHSVSDGWSLGIFFRELMSLYQAYANAQSSPLAPLPIQYADYAQWQRRWLQGAVLEQQLSYWREQLTGLPPLLSLPTDRPRPAEQTFRGSMARFALPPSLSEKLKTLSREQGVSLYMTLLSVFGVLLGRYADQQDVAVGTPIANRTRHETEGLIGFFVNTLVMRHDLSGDPRFVELLKRTRAMALQAYAHQDVPFEQLVEELNPQRSVSHSPLFQVMFDLQNAPFEAPELPGLAVRPLEAGPAREDSEGTPEGTARFDLTLSMQESPAGLVGGLEYNTDLFERGTIQRLLGHYEQLLEAVVAAPQSRLSQLKTLNEDERRRQLIDWNANSSSYPRDKSVQQLIEEQVERSPEALAVVTGDRQLSYREVNERANALAHCLIAEGVRPGGVVALCVEDVVERTVGALGILKAGAAYVPLDPDDPMQRLEYLLEDSGSELIVTQSSVRSRAELRGDDTQRRWIELPTAGCVPGYQRTNPAALAGACDLACVLYEDDQAVPVGRMVPHVGVVEESIARGQSPSEWIASLLARLRSQRDAEIRGAAHYVLDRHGELLPIGAVGELYVGGEGVSWGYRHHSGLTAQRFIPNAFGAVPGGRLYRTGERARWKANGTLERIGSAEASSLDESEREDLIEIERALSRHEAVREAVVVALQPQAQAQAQSRWVAYVVERTCGATPDEQLVVQLKAYLRTQPGLNRLPEEWMVLEALPRTAVGAVDRSALPQPQRAGQKYVAPRTPLERTLVEVWQEQLGIELIGVEDNYFTSGGDSIRSIALVAAARKRGVEFSIKDLFAYPTVSGLASAIERGDVRGAHHAEPTIEPFALLTHTERERLGQRHDREALEDAYPLSMMQQGMVLESMRHSYLNVYQNGHCYHFSAAWDRQRFEQALLHVMAEHPMLRTVFDFSGERPLQLVSKAQTPKLAVIDIRHLDRAAIQATLDRWMEQERAQPLEIASSLWRLTIHVLSDQSFIFGMFIHHSQWDGWSLESFATQLYATYGSLRAGEVPRHRQLPSYKQFIALEQSALSSEAHRSYWTQKLAGATVPWWTGREKSASAFIACELPEDTSLAVTELARSLGVQEKSVWCSVYLAFLSLLSGADEVVGTLITQGRPEIPGGDKIIGVFLNALPIRKAARGRWADLITATDHELREQHAFRHYPLVEIQRLTGLDLSGTTFHYSNWHVYYEGVDGEATREEWIPQKIGGWQETNYLLSFYVHKDDKTQRHDVGILADTEVFDAGLRERMSGYVAKIVAAIVSDATTLIEKTALLSDAERHRQLVEWNATARAHADDQCIHELFEQQVAIHAKEIAVTDGIRSLTYEELDRRANQLSRSLVAQGVGPEVTVGICTQRSVEMVVGLLGILKAGGCYVPLDPEYPPERIAYILSTSACRLVLCELDLQENLPALSTVKTFPLNGELHDQLIARYSAQPIPADIRSAPGNSAYVIFTSGSTGKPKGVRINHASLRNYLCYARDAYFSRRAGAVVSTSLSFDATVTSLLVPLVAGKFTHLLQQDSDEFDRLKQIMIAPGADLVFKLTPAHMEVLEPLLEAAVDNEHLLVIGGEQLTRRRICKWHRSLLPHSVFVNEYGPTETVVGCSTFWVAEMPWSANDSGAVPIGRPISHTSLYAVDEALQLVPMGVPGELLIAGAGVAQGYVNQPAQTAQRFIPDPFGGAAGARLYKTGDIVRWLDSGDLEYIGRTDSQIKIRGFRIELGEIEAAMLRHERVRDAVVVGRRDDSGNHRVVVYVVPDRTLGGDAGASPETDGNLSLTNALRAHAQALLPTYMQPSAIVVMDALPITGNGKRDLEALPPPDFATFQAEFVAPRNEVERSLCSYWQELLKIEKIGIHDDFWTLGGQSLLAMRVCNFVRQEFRVELKLSRMFANPSIAQLAEHISLELDSRNLSSTRLANEIAEDVEEGSF